MSVHQLLRWARAAYVLAWVTACGVEQDRDTGTRASALPPSMMQPAETNADAVPPQVPLDPSTPRDTLRAVASWPHDTAAYTQGLVVNTGRLLESTGLEGRSDVREVDRITGRIRRRAMLPTSLFGEGIAVVEGRLYQLTWRTGRGYVYDVATLAPIDSFTYTGEGWGLASDGQRLYLSDGSRNIRVVSPTGFKVQRTFEVRESGQPVWMLNELEWVRGELWANVYQTDLIARINPASGAVVGWLDAGALLSPAEKETVVKRGGVANGIAFDSARGHILVTGKRWPRLFEVDVHGLTATRARLLNR